MLTLSQSSEVCKEARMRVSFAEIKNLNLAMITQQNTWFRKEINNSYLLVGSDPQ